MEKETTNGRASILFMAVIIREGKLTTTKSKYTRSLPPLVSPPADNLIYIAADRAMVEG